MVWVLDLHELGFLALTPPQACLSLWLEFVFNSFLHCVSVCLSGYCYLDVEPQNAEYNSNYFDPLL